MYYRRTSVEAKRLDSLARSNFYSSFSGIVRLSQHDFRVNYLIETLTGIATVRAYRDEVRDPFSLLVIGFNLAQISLASCNADCGTEIRP